MPYTPSSNNPYPEDQLAELLSSEPGLAVARLLSHAGLVAASAAPELLAAISPVDPRAPEPIGPWLPVVEQGELVFARELMGSTDAMWWRPTSERDMLRQKPHAGVERTCVIGESAAAGIFYTPYYTPAIALSEWLRAERANGAGAHHFARGA
jgi:hypothetical protein